MVVRVLLAAEAALFDIAALIHAGVLAHGYEHVRARNAEAVIATVLFAGLLSSVIVPARLRVIALGTEGFALFGTLVGLLTIAIGVGPRSALDVMLHATMVSLLAAGLLVTRRATAGA